MPAYLNLRSWVILYPSLAQRKGFLQQGFLRQAKRQGFLDLSEVRL
jgi:hypothetical protein